MGDFGTARTYRLAISEVLKGGVSIRQSELLRAHLWAPRYSASSAELAEAVGYGSWRTANFQYGALAHRIAIELGVFQPPRGFWVNVLIRWDADKTRSPLGHARYLLRLEVVRALIDLGFADVPPNPSLQRTPPGRCPVPAGLAGFFRVTRLRAAVKSLERTGCAGRSGVARGE